MSSTNRLWAIGAVILMIVVLVGGWFIGVQPQLAQAAADDMERAGIEAQNQAQLAEIAALTEQNKDFDSIEAEYKKLQKSIPSSANTASFIQSLNSLSDSAGVQVTDITVSDTIAYTVPQSAVPPETPTDGATPAPSETAAPTPTAPTGYVASTSPLITPDNFVGIKVGVVVKGTYSNALAFVKGLQSGDRLMLVTGISTSALADDSGLVETHIDGMIYVLKQPKA